MAGSHRSGGTSVIASMPEQMLRQNEGTSPAPGNTAPTPTIATSLTRDLVAYVDDLRGAGRGGDLGEQACYALVRVDQRDTAPRILAFQLRGDHAAAGPRAPVDRNYPAGTPRGPQVSQRV